VLLVTLVALAFARLRRADGEEAGPVVPATRRGRAVAAALVLGAVVPLLAAAAAFREHAPTGGYDATAIWNLRARQLFLAWRDAPAAHVDSDAPLLLPAAIAAQWAALGEVDPAVPWATSLVFALSTLALTGAVARRAGGPLAGGVAAFAAGSIPFFVGEGLSQQADVPVAALLLGAWLALLDGRAPARAALGGLLLGLLVWTKHEGWVHAAIALAAFALARSGPFARLPGRRRSIASFAAGLAAGALPALAQILYWDRGRQYGVESFVGGSGVAHAAEPQRWLAPAWALVERGLEAPWESIWGAAFWVVAALLAMGLARALRQRPTAGGALLLAAVAAAGTLVFWLAAFALTPYDPAWHLATALDRLILQVLPLALAGACGCALAVAREEEPTPAHDAHGSRSERTI
jgi:hypothetical protein